MNFIWIFLLFLSGNAHRRQRLHRRLRRKVRHERYPSYYKKVTRILVLKIIKTKGRIMSIDCLSCYRYIRSCSEPIIRRWSVRINIYDFSIVFSSLVICCLRNRNIKQNRRYQIINFKVVTTFDQITTGTTIGMRPNQNIWFHFGGILSLKHK